MVRGALLLIDFDIAARFIGVGRDTPPLIGPGLEELLQEDVMRHVRDAGTRVVNDQANRNRFEILIDFFGGLVKQFVGIKVPAAPAQDLRSAKYIVAGALLAQSDFGDEHALPEVLG